MRSLEEVRKIFENDRFATENYAVIEEIGDNYAKCSVKICDRHKNAMGGVMGGVHFMLADFAFAVAANHEVMGVVSVNTNISFLSGVKGDTLYAEAHCEKDGRSMCFYTIDIYDNTGVKAASANITGCHVKPAPTNTNKQ